MRKQMAAERERRALVLRASGEREAAIARAEGEKRSKVLVAEGLRVYRTSPLYAGPAVEPSAPRVVPELTAPTPEGPATPKPSARRQRRRKSPPRN